MTPSLFLAFIRARIRALALSAAAVALFAATSAGAQNANFAPFVWSPDAPKVLALEGDIDPGAAASFAAALAAHPGVLTLRLNGGGESQSDALSIARTTRELGLATEIEAGTACVGACALVFLAGTERAARGMLIVQFLTPIGADDAGAQSGAAALIEMLIDFGYGDDLIRVIMNAGASRFGFSRHELARYAINVPLIDPPAGYDATPFAVLHELPLPEAPQGTLWPSFTASASWSLANEAGRPVLIVEIAVPGRDLAFQARFTTGDAMQSFAIETSAVTGDRFPGGGVANVFRFEPRRWESISTGAGFEAATPFLIESDRQMLNAAFLREALGRDWMKFGLVYENGQIAELLFEVGEAGRAVIDEALAAWE